MSKKISPNLIKVNVEGYEKLIFESMKKYLSLDLACPILFEFVDWAEKLANYEIGEGQQLLRDFDFKLIDLKKNIKIEIPVKNGNTMIVAKK